MPRETPTTAQPSSKAGGKVYTAEQQELMKQHAVGGTEPADFWQAWTGAGWGGERKTVLKMFGYYRSEHKKTQAERAAASSTTKPRGGRKARSGERKCEQCTGPMPKDKGERARFCSDTCRARHSEQHPQGAGDKAIEGWRAAVRRGDEVIADLRQRLAAAEAQARPGAVTADGRHVVVHVSREAMADGLVRHASGVGSRSETAGPAFDGLVASLAEARRAMGEEPRRASA